MFRYLLAMYRHTATVEADVKAWSVIVVHDTLIRTINSVGESASKYLPLVKFGEIVSIMGHEIHQL